MTQSNIVSPRLSQALAYAAAGIPVFPCIPGGKRPATPNSFRDATTDQSIIRGWWAKEDFNPAVCPEDMNCYVVDLDRKGGVDGVAAWEDLCRENETSPYETLMNSTAHNGLQLVFEGSMPPSVGKLAPGIDIRGRGSYVLLPTSVVDGVMYRRVSNKPIAEGFAWVGERLRSRELPRLTAPEGTELDQPWMVDLARAELRGLVAAGDVAKEGQGGDDRTYRLFTRLYEIGLSQARALEIAAEWNDRCDPPWDPDELESVAEHAWLYKQNEAGSKALPDPAVWGVERYAPPPAPEPPPEFPPFETMREIASQPPVAHEWVWEGRIMLNRGTLVTGDGGAGKTTLMENLAVAAASGTSLWGRSVRRMRVFMLVGEDEKQDVVANLQLIAKDRSIAAELIDEKIHVLSTETNEIEGGHVLAQITDDGDVTDTPFMRSLANQLCRGDLLIIDPRAEFFKFDRNSDDAARALGTKWVRALYRVGVTVIITEHPSTAGIARGDHFGGSRQMKSSFTTLAALIADEWQGATRNMELKFVRVKYAREHNIDLVRGDRPTFFERGGVRHTVSEEERAVYAYIYPRLAAGQDVTDKNTGDYGPKGIAAALKLVGHGTITEKTVKDAMTTLHIRGYIAKEGNKVVMSTTCPGSELPA